MFCKADMGRTESPTSGFRPSFRCAVVLYACSVRRSHVVIVRVSESYVLVQIFIFSANIQ